MHTSIKNNYLNTPISGSTLRTLSLRFIDKPMRSTQGLSSKLSVPLICGTTTTANYTCSATDLIPNFSFEGAGGSYTDPRAKYAIQNTKLALDSLMPTACKINYVWTASQIKSGIITSKQQVYTLPYVWDKGLVFDGESPRIMMHDFGISTNKLGFLQRSRITSSLLYAFFSCIKHEKHGENVVGLYFPSTTQGSLKNTKIFCRDADYSAKSVTNILLKLSRGGWVEKVKGFKGKGSLCGITTMWKPQPRLRAFILELLKDMYLESFRSEQANIVIREPLVDLPVSLEGAIMKTMSCRINEMQNVLQSVRWRYVKDSQLINIHPIELVLTRKFKFDFQSGGRIYCLAQNLPKSVRQTLTINDYPTVELDYKSLHPTILYNKEGFEAPKDSYAIPNVIRSDAKRVLLISINAKTRRVAKQSIVNTLGVSHKEAERMMAACEVLHKPIHKHFYCSSWRTLQYLDSCITMDVLSELATQGISALPVHDSYVVEEKHEAQLREAMSWAYRQNVGDFEPIVE